MNARYNSVFAILKMKIKEVIYNPGFYIILFLALLITWFLTMGFTKAVDSSGFNYTLHPLYDFIGSSLEGSLGHAFVDAVFAGGPFLFCFYAAFLPAFIFLSLNSVYRLGFERSTGVVELVSYGPADTGSYILAVFIRDCIFFAVSIGAILVYTTIAAWANNLVVGGEVLYSCLLVLMTAALFAAYSVLISVITNNTASAISLYAALIVLFALLIAANQMVVERFPGQLSRVVNMVFNWISPLYYWQLGMKGVSGSGSVLILISFAALAVLCFIILLLSHLVAWKRGVKV